MDQSRSYLELKRNDVKLVLNMCTCSAKWMIEWQKTKRKQSAHQRQHGQPERSRRGQYHGRVHGRAFLAMGKKKINSHFPLYFYYLLPTKCVDLTSIPPFQRRSISLSILVYLATSNSARLVECSVLEQHNIKRVVTTRTWIVSGLEPRASYK